MSNIKIKSSKKEYVVYFKDSFFKSLKQNIKVGDNIIIDQNVFNHLSNEQKKYIKSVNHIIILPNENKKSYQEVEDIMHLLVKNSFRKTNRLIAVGGGITQDITAFIASILFRGVDWIFFPTTLLAQADSCIGGKTSINLGKYKNQLGNFYPPSKIFIVTNFLKTLSKLDFKSGMGEMLHFYLVSGEKDFKFYQSNYEKAFSKSQNLVSLIKRNLEIKKIFIEIDEFDQKERQILNYGHTFGHAIESLTNYSIPHGIAVSYGMDISNFISYKMGFITIDTLSNLRHQLKKIWEGTSLMEININDFEKALARDKKNIDRKYQLILTKGLGKMIKVAVNPNVTFTKWLTEYFKV